VVSVDYVLFYQGDDGAWRWKRVNAAGDEVAHSDGCFGRYANVLEDAVLCNGHLRPDGLDPDKAWVSP
jgi:hypothetical protein